MINVTKFTFNGFQENTFLLEANDKSCYIIDPGCYSSEERNELSEYITHHGLKPKGVIQTHCHLDHVFGTDWARAKWNIPMGCHEKDVYTLNMAQPSAKLYGFGNFDPVEAPDFFIDEGEPLLLGDEEMEVRFTPGHCVGHIVFIHHESKFVIAGDCLFQGSIGRTDLPGGDYATLEQAIQTQLYTLPDDYTVYCGHGPETSIGFEKQNNPFVKAI